jgi:PAS domain S-box-containing protein
MNRVLLVDDREENLEYLSILLKGNGFDVECAPNGQVALELGRQHPPTIVISDLLMPVMDGYTLLRHWKRDPVLRNTHFIVYTATYTEPADEKLAMDLGADAFLVKPEEPEGMMVHITEVLTRPVAVHRDPANAGEQAALLAQHNHALIRKLEDRTHQLEAANRELLRQVSDIKAIEHRLRESEGQYLMLLNSTAEGIYGIDRHGICTFCNPAAARFLGYEDPREIVGKRVHEQHHHSRADGSPMRLDECRVHGTFLDGNAAHGDGEVFFRKDGSDFPVEYWAHPIRRDSEVIGAVIAFLDLSERKNLEAQFLQAQKMEAIGRLAGGVAHDFNNVMQVVMTCSECLVELLAGRPEELAYTSEIRAAGERGAALTRHLLAFSRKQLVRPTLLDLNAVVGDVQMLLRRMIGEDITLVTSLAREVCTVQADASQMEQVLINLAINARDAMPDGGELFIGTRFAEVTESPGIAHTQRRAGRYIVLTMRDSGSGMDPETMSKIFEPFFTTKEASKGSGLGLSTVYGIVSQSGGFVEVDSALALGSEFRVYLPAAPEMPSEPGAAPEAEQLRGGTESILLVEDEERLLTLMSTVLRSQGYTVWEANGGSAGLALAERPGLKIDLLVSDVILPDLNGPQVAERLLETHPAMKVLFVSGYTDDYISHSGVLQGETLLLEKPFSISSMLARVREALDSPALGT